MWAIGENASKSMLFHRKRVSVIGAYKPANTAASHYVRNLRVSHVVAVANKGRLYSQARWGPEFGPLGIRMKMTSATVTMNRA